jgi:hypothetical protein
MRACIIKLTGWPKSDLRLERSIELWPRRSHAERLNQFQSADGRMRSGMQIRLAAKGGAVASLGLVGRRKLTWHAPPQLRTIIRRLFTNGRPPLVHWPPRSRRASHSSALKMRSSECLQTFNQGNLRLVIVRLFIYTSCFMKIRV